MTTRWSRVVRGQSVAAFATFAAAFSHGIVDGAHPPLFAIVLAFVFSSLACVALAGVRMSRLRLGASVAVSQLLYHGLFSLFGTAGTASGTMTAHHHGALVFSPGVATAVAPASDSWMLVAHFGAAALTFATIRYGARICSALASVARLAIGSRVSTATAPVPSPARLRLPTGHRTAVPHRSVVLSSSLAHRGPPSAARFA